MRWVCRPKASCSICIGAAHCGASRIFPPQPAKKIFLRSIRTKCSKTKSIPGWGGPRYYEPSLKITRADGDRDLVLHYVSHQIKGDDLTITLKDIRDDIEVELHYTRTCRNHWPESDNP